MTNEKWTINVDEENQKVTLCSNDNELLTIDYSTDVELTELVSVLSERIDTGQQIELKKNENKDEKTALVLKTINDIIEEYNKAITTVEDVDVSTEADIF